MTTADDDPDFATTLAHGIAVLHCFSVARPTLGNRELAEMTGLSKATISRLTYTLAARGLVVLDADLRRYRLGSTALTIGYPLMASLRVRQVARRHMQRLADETGGSVSLGLRDRTRMVYVETCRGHDLAAWRPDIGAVIPILPTAMGRAWLAAVDAPLAREAVARAVADGQGTAAAATRVVREARHSVASHGWALSRGDWRSDVHAIAVPLPTLHDGERLVMNCGVLTTRLAPSTIDKRVGPALMRLVRDVEREMAEAAR